MGTGNDKITNDMEEVAKELTISSLRGSQVNINLDDFEGDSLKSHPFPVFHRKSFIGSNNVSKYPKLQIYFLYFGNGKLVEITLSIKYLQRNRYNVSKHLGKSSPVFYFLFQ